MIFTPPLYVLILAGGQGTRFWPRSRARLPKQLLPIAGEDSLLHRTLKRLHPLVPPERMFVVTAQDQVEALRPHAAHLPPHHILAEPSARNTAAAIGLGLAWMRHLGMPQEAVVAVLPSDHAIASEAGFRDTLAVAARAAWDRGAICTLGMPPDRPDTGYGYLRVGEMVEPGFPGVYRLDAFIEKPDRSRAESLLHSGGHLWNGGMFIFPSHRLDHEMQRHLPSLAASLAEIQGLWDAGGPQEEVARIYSQAQPISIDYGIMEKAEGLLVVPGTFGWSDVGNWSRIPDALPEGEGGWISAPRVVALESRGNVVEAPGKLVALLGVKDLVIVDTEDVLMVIPRDRAEEVRSLLERVRARGWEDCV